MKKYEYEKNFYDEIKEAAEKHALFLKDRDENNFRYSVNPFEFFNCYLRCGFLAGKDLRSICLQDCFLESLDFNQCNLYDSIFFSCVFRDVTFEEANLEGCEFHNCKFMNVNFKNANLEDSVFNGIIMKKCNLLESKEKSVYFGNIKKTKSNKYFLTKDEIVEKYWKKINKKYLGDKNDKLKNNTFAIYD